ncbi:urotensin-2 receptor [Erpetoichthys calabaricus]|uniref:urotensin-2 receptor n=1 Tax=Erpetoichthys calabaricus TaxID=27687 RepID=UPI0010A0308F|nr:urotensin-2 receptor [Erpetoichthys calabaricus]
MDFWQHSGARQDGRLQSNSSTFAALTKNQSASLSPNSSASSKDDMVITAVIGTILSVMCIVGVAGNLYTLAVVRRRRGRSNSSLYVHVLNLALADLLYLSTAPFIVYDSFAPDWAFGEAGCRILLSLDLLTMHASIFILTIMSSERYAAISRPLATARSSRGYRKVVAPLVWVLSLGLTLPMMVMIHLEERPVEDGDTRKLCAPTWSDEDYRTYLTVLFVTSILAPGIIIGFLYAGLARIYWTSQTKGQLGNSRPPKLKVLYMIFTIVLAFWACFLPFWVWQLLPLYHPEALRFLPMSTEIYINHLVTCLTYGNSCVNPFLYTLLTKNYREYRHGQLSSQHKSVAHTFLASYYCRRGAPSAGQVRSGTGMASATETVILTMAQGQAVG